MQQKMITQKRTQAECRPRYQEVAVDHTAVSDMKYKQMNRAVLTEFFIVLFPEAEQGQYTSVPFPALVGKSGNQTWIQGWHCI